jgi:Transposase DDE domain
VVGAVCADRAVLSEARQWPSADWHRADAAHLFLAALVQSVGPGGGGGALRFVGNAALCRHRPPPSRGQALGREPVPDETTVCRFRHLLEAHDLGQPLFDEVQRHLASKGVKVATGTIVDATIINAPSSTKNADKARDPEMHQTKKGNQWYFGMKAHFGVDSRTKLIHAVQATPANVADSKVLPDLLPMYLIAEFLDEHCRPAIQRAATDNHGDGRGLRPTLAAPHTFSYHSATSGWAWNSVNRGASWRGYGALIEHVVSECREAQHLDPSRRCRDGHRRGSRRDRRTLSRRAPSSMPMPRPYRGTSLLPEIMAARSTWGHLLLVIGETCARASN